MRVFFPFVSILSTDTRSATVPEDRSSRTPSIKDRVRGAVQDSLDWLGEVVDGLLMPQPELVPIPVRRPENRRR